MSGNGSEVRGEGDDTAEHVSVYGVPVVFFVLMVMSYDACFLPNVGVSGGGGSRFLLRFGDCSAQKFFLKGFLWLESLRCRVWALRFRSTNAFKPLLVLIRFFDWFC